MVAKHRSLDSKRPIVIAHRGASAYLPEHTLAAEAMSYAFGPDFVEPDVVLTKDSVPIVLHDVTLERTTDVAKRFPKQRRADGRFYAIDFTFAEIKTLRVHERIRLTSGERVFPGRFPLHYSRFEVPAFAELIELIIGLNRSTGHNIGIYPEIKQPEFHTEAGYDLAKITHDLFHSYAKEWGTAPLYWQCFHAETLERFASEFASPYPRILLIEDGDLELSDPIKLDQAMAKVAKYAHGIGPSLSHTFREDGQSTRLVELAHKHGLLVHAYTVRADQMPSYVSNFDAFLSKIFFEEKIDGVFTDFTDRVVDFLRRHQ